MDTISARPYRVIGKSPIRADGYDKVTGKAIYGSDVRISGAIWGSVLRSAHPHARIHAIDTSEARNSPGVLAVITSADLPPAGPEPIDMASAFVDPDHARQNILAGSKVLYPGHPVAAVAAMSQMAAAEAILKIKVEYEPLPAVFDVDAATAPGAPILLEDMEADHLGEPVTGTNIAWHFRYELGDPEVGFDRSSLTIEREFSSPTIHQGYVEPHNATALWDEDDRIQIWTSTQGLFGVRKQVGGILGVDESRITVYPVEIGGGFGGKTVVYLAPLAALLSRIAGRPVRMAMDRKAVFESTGPAPGGRISVKIGVDDGGRIQAATASIRLEAGAFPGWAAETASKSVFSCYDIQNARVDGFDILVNKPKTNAYRAPGAPQVTFATESVIDEICDEMGWDPIEFRLANASGESTRRVDGPRLGKIGVRETLQAARASNHWDSALAPAENPGRRRGRGVASAFVLFSGRESTATLNLNNDGTVSLVEGSVDINGTRTAIAMQAAEVLGIPLEDVRAVVGHTGTVGSTEISHGSRTTFATGWAACEAARQLIDAMRRRVADLWQIDVAGTVYESGTFYSGPDKDLAISFRDAAAALGRSGAPISVTASVDPASPAQGVFSCHIADVEVDIDTGKVEVLRYTAVQDVGRAIHLAQVEGQIQGAVAQGIGWALNEEYFYDADGRMANHTFQDYRMPTSADLPNIEPIIVEVPNTQHPFGVRGAGEVSIAPPPAAIANAIFAATGIRLRELPMKPGRVLAALQNGARG